MRALRLLLGAACLAGSVALTTLVVTAQVNGKDPRIDVMDDCLPGDPAWDPTGGCTLKPHQGDVPFAEFGALLTSPLAQIQGTPFLIGHPSWRNEPSYITIRPGQSVRVTNRGGRGHTFTEVEHFGGGFVGGLNVGLTAADECVPPTKTIPLAPGAAIALTPAGEGLHKFQCCIHPWMRATIRVE